MKTQKIQVQITTDENGKNVAEVPLSNSDKQASLYEADFRELMDLGVSPKWHLYNNGICFHTPKNSNHSVARVVTDAFKERVAYLDGDKTNLRRDNLVLDRHRSCAKMRARDLVVPTPRLHKLEVELIYKQRVTSTGAGSVHG